MPCIDAPGANMACMLSMSDEQTLLGCTFAAPLSRHPTITHVLSYKGKKRRISKMEKSAKGGPTLAAAGIVVPGIALGGQAGALPFLLKNLPTASTILWQNS